MNVGGQDMKKQTVAAAGIAVILMAIAVVPGAGIHGVREEATPDELLPSQTNQGGATLYVGGSGPGNYTTIQGAIDNASDGDTVYVYNGTYAETIRIQQSIYLVGEHKHGTVIDGAGSGTVVAIYGDRTSMKHFTVTGGADDGATAAVQIHADEIAFENNVVRDNQHHGIILASASRCTLSRNVITGNSYHGIHVIDASGSNNMSHNHIQSGIAGIYVGSPNPQTISYNRVSNCSKGIYLEESSGNAILGNHIAGNQEGLFCSYAPGNTIQYNNFISNTRHARFVAFLHAGFLVPNTWSHNYWDDWMQVGGKAILGAIYVPTPALIGIFVPWLNLDWHPASEPYEWSTE